MKAKRYVVLIIMAIFLFTGCQQVDVADQGTNADVDVNQSREDLTYLPMLSDQYMKGYELYSWQAGDSWTFSLLVGTNRVKCLDEIKSEDVMLENVEKLLSELGYLQQGENVLWSSNRVSGIDLPPDTILNQVSDFSQARGIQLHIER